MTATDLLTHPTLEPEEEEGSAGGQGRALEATGRPAAFGKPVH